MPDLVAMAILRVDSVRNPEGAICVIMWSLGCWSRDLTVMAMEMVDSALWQPQSPLMAGHTSLTFPLLFISSSLSSISLDIDIIINKGEGVGLRKQEKQQKRKFLKDMFLFLRGCVGGCWKPWPSQEPPRNAEAATRPFIWLIASPPTNEFITSPASDATIVEVPSRCDHHFNILPSPQFQGIPFSYWF